MSAQNTKDVFELRIFFSQNPLADWNAARGAVEVLLREAGDLAPTTFRPRYDKREPLKMEALERYFRRRDPSDVLVLSGDRGIEVEWTGYPPRTTPASKLIARIPFPLIADPAHAERIIALTRALCNLIAPLYGWGHSEEDVRLAKDPHVTDALAPLVMGQMYWLTVLGASMLKNTQPGQVNTTPAYHVELLKDGSALIVTSPLPSECLSHTAREAQAKALHHLRPDLPADHILHDLLDRSSKLQPATEQLNPDFAELFRMIIDSVPLSERRAKQLELTSYRPPEITEWRPASETLPPDVPDVDDAIDTYHRQAQTFIAGHHDEIPDLMEAAPEVLPRIDAFFYARDYLRNEPATLQRLMLPTVGAYLGTMLERYLDGRWVPRQNLEESQVVIGDRAWLPFLRVQHFLQSKQAAIDFSLNSYYREAERHAPDR